MHFISNLTNILATQVQQLGFFKKVVTIIKDYYPNILEGIANTLLIALIGTVIGLLIGVLTGLIRTIPLSKNPVVKCIQKIVNVIISIYVEIFRGTPMMVQSMVIFWGFAGLTGGNTLPVIPAGIIIVSINTGAYMAEIVRGGIISIDKGQFEGAHSLGMNHAQTMFNVIIPQMFRNILPSVSNEFVINVKDTSVLNVIGVYELYKIGDIIIKGNFWMFETYLVICVIYFILTFTITRILRLIEKKLAGNENYVICGSQSNPDAEIKVGGTN
ncbi:MAG: amino acid ABC transporter permease [Clostridia bacterium]|nr:amino acid ABC transporter permease [Clostridia bacterium]